MNADETSHRLPRWRFRLQEPADLADMNERLGLSVRASEDVSVLSEPVAFDGLTIPNSLAVHPMEGCDGDASGRPGPLAVRRYERFAAGGAGLLWMEASAVVSEGRANPRQLWLHEGSKDAFAVLLERIRMIASERHGRAHRPVLVLQLTHSGRYARPEGQPAAMMARCVTQSDVALKVAEQGSIVTDEYLDRLVARYVGAAQLAYDVGFDAVDIKACHGYLINDLLGARRREGRYGGSFENRTRLLLDIVDRVHSDLGADKRVVTRLGVFDGVALPDGWGVSRNEAARADLKEPKRLIDMLTRRGVKMINVTVGSPYVNPHYGRPYNEPIVEGYPSTEHPLAGVGRMIDLAADIQQSFKDLIVVGTGYSWLRSLLPHVAAATKTAGGATIVGAGRMALAYPDFAADILQKGRLDPDKVCIACSGCTQIMRDGGRAGCVVRDADVYRPIFERGRRTDRKNLLRLAEDCRRCEDATCTRGCPASVDVPSFIGRFLAGDDRGAYEVLRQANIFPQICAELCPVDEQCQGHCLRHFTGDAAIPIADIQRFLAREANARGWSRLRLPVSASGRRAAVIGAGPAGLACAAVLLEKGHYVTVFDKAGRGGMVRSAIPDERLRESLGEELQAVFQDVPSERLDFRHGVELSAEMNLDAILDEGFEAAFIGVGLSRAGGAGGDRLEGLTDALTFLRLAKQDEAPNLAGRRVAVIGGGNTAMDAAVMARRLGAADVYLIYRRSLAEMPASIAERRRAMAAGVHFVILTQPGGFRAEAERLTGIELCPTVPGEPDESGRRRPVPLEGRTYELPMDFVIEAVGQQAPEDLDRLLPGVRLRGGLVETAGDSTATSRPGVFAGGDIVRGPSTVVEAVRDGMQAGREIDRRLAAPAEGASS